jgi:hypothetical protein
MSLDSTPDLPSMLPSAEEADRELAAARELARRYRLEFVDLTTAELDYDLIHSHPVDLMTRYKFVPLRQENGRLLAAMADPTNLDALDELSAQLKVRIKPAVATPSRPPCAGGIPPSASCRTPRSRSASSSSRKPTRASRTSISTAWRMKPPPSSSSWTPSC